MVGRTDPVSSGADPVLSIKQSRVIGAAADHASFAGVGAALGLSHSSISRIVTEAERALGHQLFERGWAGMEPSAAGTIVGAHCARMMAAIGLAQSRLRALGRRPVDLAYYLSWRQLDVLEAVRTNGSASAAARYLGLSQPDVSRALAKLEPAIGQRPFERTGSGLRPTEFVEILSDLRSTLLLETNAIPIALAALDGEISGRVAVGLLPFSEQDVVVRVFAKLLADHRHLKLQAVTGSYGALIEALVRGELDFILGSLREPAPTSALLEEYIHDEWLTLVVSDRHPLASRRPALADLARASWIVGPHGTPTRRYLETLLAGAGLDPPSQVCEMITFSLAEQMIAESDAIGLLTYSPRKRANLRRGLKLLPIELPDGRRRIGMTRGAHRELTDAQALFASLLAKDLNCG